MRTQFLIIPVLLGFAFFLLFYNLDGHLLWGDEAETATLAKNILRWGVPKTFDGINRITLYGSENDANKDDVWTWSPWVQEYVAAAAFSIFGPTTWSSRVFFALIAWLSLVFLALITYKIYRDPWIVLAAVILLGSSEVFLLHARQCRYYSITVLGEILFIYSIYQLLIQNRNGMWSLAFALILQFYSNYIIAAANVPILLPLIWTLYKVKRSSALQVAVSLSLVLVAVVPWLAYAHVWRQSDILGHENLAHKYLYYVREFHFHFMPLVFIFLPVVGFIMTKSVSKQKIVQSKKGSGKELRIRVRTEPKGKNRETGSQPVAILSFERLLLLLLPLYAGVLLIPPGEFLRYLLPLLPIACLLTASWVFRYIHWRAVAMSLVFIQCLTNILALGTAYPWKGQHTLSLPLVKYIQGITHRYTDRFADVLGFLSREAKPGQTVYVFDPEFPLQFYTALKIIDGRLIKGAMTEPLPDWILPESASGVPNPLPPLLPADLDPYYDAVTLSVHNSKRNGVIPDPDVYQYDIVETRPFVLYKKRNALPLAMER